ncbi:amidase [Ancylobacter sp. A5.8]|uniref:amidase n=1 Tax=Ancylobacter gelatini TaxID=2919920 RepID=UPI001F4E15BA|nr:amidase [Ancylobacter gelatini]MCJ8141794.1 amidase [Ancylobacter gelatini]
MDMRTSETGGLDAMETGALIRSGALTSVGAVRASLARIDRLDPTLHAFVLRLDERALEMAAERDAERDAGRLRGPLHGVPVAVKDLFDIEGFRTGSGSRCFPDHVAQMSATAVRRLEAAGAIIVGKTHTVEFAFGGWGTNPVLGAPRNPFDVDVHRAPGGSSSGSAVSVASGMVPLALATDTGGSVRIPAAFCGLFGHKSTPGLIGRGGMRFLSRSHDSIGALARSVRDLRAVIALLAGPDPDDAASGDAPTDLFTPARPIGAFRLATFDDPAFARLDEEVRAIFEATLVQLGQRFGEVARIAPPVPMETLCAQAGRLMAAESYATLHAVTEDPATDIAPEIRARINLGREVTATELAGLHELKRTWKAHFATLFAPFDVLVMPGMPILPPPLAEIDQSNMALSIFGRYVNMLDLCAVSAPVGLSRDGLPVGVQLIGRPFADAHLLDLAGALEQEGLAACRPPSI